MIETSQIILAIIIYILSFILSGIPLYVIYRKAGYRGWPAFVPIYRSYIFLRLIKKPIWWLIILLIPFIGLLVAFIMLVDLAKCFGKFMLWQQALIVIPFINILYLYWLAFSPNEHYYGPEHAKTFRRSAAREWVDAIIFALVAAVIIRTFIFEPYTIPTQSMEETLMVNDFIFVSKLNLGPRIPITPIFFPLAHNTLPLIGGKSYLDWPQLPYMRLPGWQTIKNNDIIVFNWPADKGRPVDRKENYIKRCIGIAGDSIQLKNGDVYINGEFLPFPKHAQLTYDVMTNGEVFGHKFLIDNDISYDKRDIQEIQTEPGAKYRIYRMMLTQKQVDLIKRQPYVTKVSRFTVPANMAMPDVFPSSNLFSWNLDNFGPLYIPKKGASVPMNAKNYALYQTAIRRYEHNPSLTLKGDTVWLDGHPIQSYTFKMNYYFMMGDNRYNSLDSRFWGFVPEDHIVGKPILIFLAFDKEEHGWKFIRWKRLFRSVKNAEN